MLGWGDRRTEPGWVAVATLGGRARIVHVVRREGERPVLRWAQAAAWTDPVATLRGLRRSRGLARLSKVALLERLQYQLLPIDAPDAPREDWRDAARWSLKDTVDFAMDDAGIDLLEVPNDPAQHRRATLIAVAAPHAQLAPLAAAGADAGLPWQAIDVPETALRNIAALTEEPGRAQALLHTGETHSTLVVTVGGELLLARHIDVSLGQLTAADEDTRTPAYERASLELQRTLDSVERQFSHLSLSRVLVCPGAPLAAFVAYARELVYAPVAPLDLAAHIDLSAVPELADPIEQAAWLPAIGAALRH